MNNICLWLSSDLNTDSIHPCIPPSIQQTSMLNIYYTPRFVPDGAKRKMSDMMPDMNSSSQERPREKNLKTNVTVPHKLKLHRCPRDDMRAQDDNTLPPDGKRGGRYSSQREQYVQRAG